MKNTSLFIIAFLSLLVSCSSQKSISVVKSEQKATKPEYIQSEITLLFGGDIMAHKPNFNMKDYSLIWKDIAPLVKASDLAFANLETTVNDNAPNESYPTFNVKSSYADEAVKSGFNVFSLANNHTNDHGLEGIQSTKLWAEKTAKKTAKSSRPFYFSGTKGKEDDFSYSYFTVNGWKILFIAITEILNQQTYLSYMNYVPNTEKSRTAFIEKMKSLRQSHECDLFIISVHANEPEYVMTIYEKQKKFYNALLKESGADVIWANHPHVVKDWEVIGSNEDKQLHKLIMYSNGNTISGQRWEPMFNEPETARDYTGDGLLLQATFTKKVYTDGHIEKPVIQNVTPFFITTYIDSKWQFVIKKLDADFISELDGSNFKTWAKYLRARKTLMEKVQGNILWQ